jgi:hypothetical protein
MNRRSFIKSAATLVGLAPATQLLALSEGKEQSTEIEPQYGFRFTYNQEVHDIYGTNFTQLRFIKNWAPRDIKFQPIFYYLSKGLKIESSGPLRMDEHGRLVAGRRNITKYTGLIYWGGLSGTKIKEFWTDFEFGREYMVCYGNFQNPQRIEGLGMGQIEEGRVVVDTSAVSKLIF